MATRAEILAEYETDEWGGITIKTPGRFEGEPAYVVYFWDMVMDGSGDLMTDPDCQCGPDDMCECESWDRFTIDDDDLVEWPELEGAVVIDIGQSDVGFIWTRTLTADQLAKETVEATE